jgi:hypothetical protein
VKRWHLHRKKERDREIEIERERGGGGRGKSGRKGEMGRERYIRNVNPAIPSSLSFHSVSTRPSLKCTCTRLYLPSATKLAKDEKGKAERKRDRLLHRVPVLYFLFLSERRELCLL